MFMLKKRMEVSGAHCLNLPYPSKCNNLHGHNWIIEITIKGPELNKYGMLLDFSHIKEVVNQLDHTNINLIFGEIKTTAENMGPWIAKELEKRIEVDKDLYTSAEHLPKITMVSVQESEGNIACYIP